MSPVEICGMPNFWVIKAAWVPLPAPGGPSRISRMSYSWSVVFLTFSDYAAMQQFVHDGGAELANLKSIYNRFANTSRMRAKSSGVSTPAAGWDAATRTAME